MKLEPHDDAYPRSLYALDEPPPLEVSGPLRAARVFAIAGSREATKDEASFAYSLAYFLAKAGVAVVSGGAVGVDQAAHEGALVGGVTWLVSPTGRDHVYPAREENGDLVGRIEESDRSRVIWPFADHVTVHERTLRYRNGILVGLAERVIIVRARYRSGSRSTALWARRLGRALHVVPASPWEEPYSGSLAELVLGARPLWTVEDFFEEVGLPRPDRSDPLSVPPGLPPLWTPQRSRPRRRVRPQTFSERPRFEVDPSAWSEDERRVFSVLSGTPTQQDSIIAQAGLPASSTLTALLTLSLRDVVVEGPDGFFRSRVSL